MPKKKQVKKQQIEELKQALADFANKVRWANEEQETPPAEEKVLTEHSEANKSLSDKYRAAYSSVYNALPHWKRQVIDEKLYDDRIYNEFAKDVIRNAEAE